MEGLSAALLGASRATAVEIRLDAFREDVNRSIRKIEHLLPRYKPVIFTLRSREQGGYDTISLEDQLGFWLSLPQGLRQKLNAPDSNIFVDWSMDLFEFCYGKRRLPPSPWKVGCSWHDFEKTPMDLAHVLRVLESRNPNGPFVKLVTKVRSQHDVERIRQLFDRRGSSQPLIAFGMGDLGENSRLECLGWGSFGTYGYVPGRAKAAPGQLSIDQLLDDARVQAALAA